LIENARMKQKYEELSQKFEKTKKTLEETEQKLKESLTKSVSDPKEQMTRIVAKNLARHSLNLRRPSVEARELAEIVKNIKPEAIPQMEEVKSESESDEEKTLQVEIAKEIEKSQSSKNVTEVFIDYSYSEQKKSMDLLVTRDENIQTDILSNIPIMNNSFNISIEKKVIENVGKNKVKEFSITNCEEISAFKQKLYNSLYQSNIADISISNIKPKSEIGINSQVFELNYSTNNDLNIVRVIERNNAEISTDENLNSKNTQGSLNEISLVRTIPRAEIGIDASIQKLDSYTESYTNSPIIENSLNITVDKNKGKDFEIQYERSDFSLNTVSEISALRKKLYNSAQEHEIANMSIIYKKEKFEQGINATIDIKNTEINTDSCEFKSELCAPINVVRVIERNNAEISTDENLNSKNTQGSLNEISLVRTIPRAEIGINATVQKIDTETQNIFNPFSYSEIFTKNEIWNKKKQISEICLKTANLAFSRQINYNKFNISSRLSTITLLPKRKIKPLTIDNIQIPEKFYTPKIQQTLESEKPIRKQTFSQENAPATSIGEININYIDEETKSVKSVDCSTCDENLRRPVEESRRRSVVSLSIDPLKSFFNLVFFIRGFILNRLHKLQF